MQPLPRHLLLAAAFASCTVSATWQEDVRWRVDNQKYDLVLNPQTLPALTGHAFEVYSWYGEERLVISDLRDGLWRVEPDARPFQLAPPGPAIENLPGDRHVLSFNQARNVLIENLDIYAHVVEEALKFSRCANIVIRNCNLVAGPQSEDAADIVRGQNYTFDRVTFIGLGDRSLTVKGSARYVDVVESRFGLRYLQTFFEVFRGQEVEIGGTVYRMGDRLLPRKAIPGWALGCWFNPGAAALAVEAGGWSDYDIGFIDTNGNRVERPPTRDIRIEAIFTDGMSSECDRSDELVPVLQWHTAEGVQANGWVFNPTHTSILGSVVEELYYEESRPSPAEEAELREQLGPELDYFGVELPRYRVQQGEYGNQRFFGALYNAGSGYLFSPAAGWLFTFDSEPPGGDFPQPGTWFYHYTTATWLLYLDGRPLPRARWWNATTGQNVSGNPG